MEMLASQARVLKLCPSLVIKVRPSLIKTYVISFPEWDFGPIWKKMLKHLFKIVFRVCIIIQDILFDDTDEHRNCDSFGFKMRFFLVFRVTFHQIGILHLLFF